MNLRGHSGRKWGLETESKPKLKESICIIKLCPIKWITPVNPMGLTISLHWVKVLILIKLYESQDSFETEMSSRTRIKTEIEGILLNHNDMSN